jgi:hypothetical protein
MNLKYAAFEVVLQSPPWSVPAPMVTEGAEDGMAEALRPCTMAAETNDVRMLILLGIGWE